MNTSKPAFPFHTVIMGGGSVTESGPTLENPWTVAREAPLAMEFSRQEYCSGLPVPYPGDLPNLEMEPGSPALQAGFFYHQESPVRCMRLLSKYGAWPKKLQLTSS